MGLWDVDHDGYDEIVRHDKRDDIADAVSSILGRTYLS
jgi:hypothetical protein